MGLFWAAPLKLGCKSEQLSGPGTEVRIQSKDRILPSVPSLGHPLWARLQGPDLPLSSLYPLRPSPYPILPPITHSDSLGQPCKVEASGLRRRNAETSAHLCAILTTSQMVQTYFIVCLRPDLASRRDLCWLSEEVWLVLSERPGSCQIMLQTADL